MIKRLHPLLLTGALLFTLTVRAQESSTTLDINVRSGVNWDEQQKRDHDPAYGPDAKRGRNFYLVRVSEEKTGERLVRPIDARALAQQVAAQLEAHGFHAIRPGQKPEIVITVKYGRGLLSNPYTNSEDDKEHTGLSDTGGMQIWPTHEHFVGLNEKLIRMSYEKLFVQVRAWEYPPPANPKKKEKLLWMTTMFVDDPDHRDLNQIAGKMLEQGAPYFDRHIGREQEVIINTAAPAGHVNVGPVEVVKDPKK